MFDKYQSTWKDLNSLWSFTKGVPEIRVAIIDGDQNLYYLPNLPPPIEPKKTSNKLTKSITTSVDEKCICSKCGGVGG